MVADQNGKNREGDHKDSNQTGDQAPSAHTIVKKGKSHHGGKRNINVETFGDQFMLSSELSYEQTFLERLQNLEPRYHGKKESKHEQGRP